MKKIDGFLVDVFKEWSGLISDPAIHEAKEVIVPDITGIAINFAGDWLPRGRETFTNISIKSLDTYLSEYGNKTIQNDKKYFWDWYGKLYLALNWKLLGRNESMASHLLHLKNSKELVLHIDLSRDGETPPNASFAEIRLGDLWRHIKMTDEEKKSLASKLLGMTANAHREEINGVAEELKLDMTNGILDRHLNEGLMAFRVEIPELIKNKKLDSFLNKKAEAIFKLTQSNETSVARKSIETVVHNLFLLSLYQPMAGGHAYFICPKGALDEVRTCFVAWSNSRINKQNILRLKQTATKIHNELNKKLKDSTPAKAKPNKTQTIILRKLIGSKLAKEVGEKMSNSHAWLGHYLALCERLSSVAVHEGEKLGFSFFVSGGEAASKEVEFLSRLSEGDKCRWEVTGELMPKKDCEEVISRLLGNCTFLQAKGSVVQCTWQGHLLALVKLLHLDKSPEEVTEGHEDAYLIHLEKNGDIKTFYMGKLVLWRRGAKWLIPQLWLRLHRKT